MKLSNQIYLSLCVFIFSTLTVSAASVQFFSIPPVAFTMPSPTIYKSNGMVKALDHDSGKLELDHQAISKLNLPADSHAFQIQHNFMLEGLIVGNRINFDFFVDKNGNYVIVNIRQVS